MLAVVPHSICFHGSDCSLNNPFVFLKPSLLSLFCLLHCCCLLCCCGFGWVWLLRLGFVGGVVWLAFGWLVGNCSVVCFTLGLFKVWLLYGFGLVLGWFGIVA